LLEKGEVLEGRVDWDGSAEDERFSYLIQVFG